MREKDANEETREEYKLNSTTRKRVGDWQSIVYSWPIIDVILPTICYK